MSAAIYVLLNFQDEGTVNILIRRNEKIYSKIIVTEILNLVLFSGF